MIKMDCPAQAVQYWKQHICTAPEFNADVECVVVLVLNVRLRIKGHYIVSTGTLCEAMAEAREVFRIAIMAAAHGIVLLHNLCASAHKLCYVERPFMCSTEA